MKERAWCLAMCLGGGVALAFANAYGIPCLSNNVTACLINGGIDGLDRPMVLLADLLLLKLTCAGGESVLAYLRRRLELTVGASIVNRVFARMLRAKPSFFEGMDSEGAVRRALRDAETLAAWRVALWSDLPLALAAGVLAVGTMFCGGWNCPALGIVAQQGCPMLAVVVLVLSPTHFLFLIWNRRFAREEQRQAEASEAQYAVGIEMLRGIADLRAACAFAFADNRMGKSTGSAVRAQSRVQALLSFLQGTDNAVASLAEVSLIAVAARMIVLPGSGFGYADYVGFVALQMAFHAALSRIVDMAFSWLKAKPAARRISELESVPQIVTGEERMTAEGGGAAPSIRLCHVTVTTETGARILSNMTFSARSGEHVALVGPSGCGKSTLLKVVAR